MTDREARLNALRDAAAKPGVPSSAGGYYDRPLLKPPVWTWEVPAYFFAGGAAGAAAMIAAVGAFAGADVTLVRDARWIAAAGALLSPLLLISGSRPSRSIPQHAAGLQVPQPHVGRRVDAGALRAGRAPADRAALLRRRCPGRWSRALDDGRRRCGRGATGLVLATYTGVLLAVSAIPVWAAHARMLPLHFGASSLGAAVSIVELCGHCVPSLNTIGLVAAVVETAIGIGLERRRGSGTHRSPKAGPAWSCGSPMSSRDRWLLS